MTDTTAVNSETSTGSEPSLKVKATKAVDTAKTRLKDAQPQIEHAVERAAAAGQGVLQTTREKAQPVTGFVRRHRRVLTAVAIAAGAGAAAFLALRRFPQAPRQARRLTANLTKAALASGAVEKALGSAKDLGQSAARRLAKLETLRAPEIRLTGRQARKLERQFAKLKSLPDDARDLLKH